MKIYNFYILLSSLILFSSITNKHRIDNQTTYVMYKLGSYYVSSNDFEKKTGNDSVLNKRKKVLEKIEQNQSMLEFELLFDKNSSIFKLVDKIVAEKNMDYKIASIVNGGNLTHYKNIIAKEKMYQVEFQGQKFNVELPFEQYKWEITNTVKYIAGFKCFKATTTLEKNDNGRNIRKILHPVVWFTSEIPTSFGPNGLDGLPGLVLEGSLDGRTFFYASKIIQNYKEKHKIEKPSNGIDISEEKYLDMGAKIYYETRELLNKNK
ncbi:GLPGLI family protein [Flavobacterium acetivorans]|uniref:GLPGLI family protein n=1 Tax=Flavobacterium acetivorans TaxID=2893883 RepID=UPI001E57C79E|nr:GLPGLI family protein [Flavobacterium sp. F-29]UFH34647.1 GLPGLI family protein [Flavobacterium sp. F-29]